VVNIFLDYYMNSVKNMVLFMRLYLPVHPSNEIVERKDRTLTELVNVMLDTTDLSKPCWRGLEFQLEIKK
jgi:hypothetical protein